VDAAGVLAPSGTQGVWQLRPHDPADVLADFRTVTATQAGALPSGQRVYVAGIALNAWSAFGDSTVHVADASGAVRALRVQPAAVVAGDSVRVLGTTGRSDGHPALLDASLRVLSFGRGLPRLDSVSTAAAATAGGGARANGQVRVAGVVQDTMVLGGDLVLGVSDGSGRLEVVLDRNIQFNPAAYVPGATFVGAGVLVPAPGGSTWRLKPRDRDDATITFATRTVASARATTPGVRVVVEGHALNAWSAFGDSTVHVADATGAIRALRVQETNVQAGDSVRLIGVVTTNGGQPVVTQATVSLVLRGIGLVPMDSLTTGAAAGASGGTRDAALVRVGGTIVGAQPLGTSTLVTVDDGSGGVDVWVGAGAMTSNLAPGAGLGATGVLVPNGSGRWQLRPRTTGDLQASQPTVTIATARTLPAGRQVNIVGIALNGWFAFGDSTVHVSDVTGTIRAVRLPSSAIFTGDSVRISGTMSVRNGQPVISGGSAAVLRTAARTPFALLLNTVTAANAQNGLRDAALVMVTGNVQDTPTIVGGDVILQVNDGSGPVTVVLDRDVGFATGGYASGMSVRVTGVLVPSDDRSRWELKPRMLADFQVVSGAPPARAPQGMGSDAGRRER
jgi:hypothetical protein